MYIYMCIYTCVVKRQRDQRRAIIHPFDNIWMSTDYVLRQHKQIRYGEAAAAAKSLQLCPTLCDPIDNSPPGSPVPGILQARTLEGLPFPSPMHESEKWKGSRSVVSDSSQPHGLQPARLLRPWDFPGKSTGVGCHCLLPPSVLLTNPVPPSLGNFK